MNRWKEVWEKRPSSIEINDDSFDMFVKLKRADGFDTHIKSNYYENLFRQWKEMKKRIEEFVPGPAPSVFEVGCGSGADLYLFQKIGCVSRVGGIDYSKPLTDIARKVLLTDDVTWGEALDMNIERKYDVVLADSVFQYFQNDQYGLEVMGNMFTKANYMIIITEIHDKEKEQEHLSYRKAMETDYERLYDGLDKTFYDKEPFIKFALKNNCRYQIVVPQNKAYWNNDFVFDFYLYKQPGY